MKKLLILILTFSLFSCSVNNNVKEDILESNFVIGNFNGYYEENIDLENIYKTEKNLLISFGKSGAKKLENISNFNGEKLKIEFSFEENINLDDFLQYLVGAKGEKLEIVKNFPLNEKEENIFLDITVEQAKILKNLDFKNKKIFLVDMGVAQPKCSQEVYDIIPEICEENTYKNDFVIGNFDEFYEENVDLENIYKTEKNLVISFGKSGAKKLENISNFNGEKLKLDLRIRDDVNLDDFLQYLIGAKGEKLEIVKNFEEFVSKDEVFLNISVEQAKILKDLDFKEKNIYLVGSGLVSKPKCLEEVYEIIPEICEN